MFRLIQNVVISPILNNLLIFCGEIDLVTVDHQIMRRYIAKFILNIKIKKSSIARKLSALRTSGSKYLNLRRASSQ